MVHTPTETGTSLLSDARHFLFTKKQVIFLAVAALMVLSGGGALYYVTMPPSASSTSSSTSGTSSGSTCNSQSPGCQLNGQPEGAWANYLGYLPAGYVPAPLPVNAGIWQCPPGMGASACKEFQATCGNGVCDPNESCATCPIDCGPPGELTCDPYTGRIGAPVSICQLGPQA